MLAVILIGFFDKFSHQLWFTLNLVSATIERILKPSVKV